MSKTLKNRLITGKIGDFDFFFFFSFLSALQNAVDLKNRARVLFSCAAPTKIKIAEQEKK